MTKTATTAQADLNLMIGAFVLDSVIEKVLYCFVLSEVAVFWGRAGQSFYVHPCLYFCL